MICNAAKEIKWLILEQKETSYLLDWWKFWEKRRAHILEILHLETASTTNNVAKITHSSWSSAGGENMTLAETCIFDLCHAFLIEAHIEGMYNLSHFM